MRKLDEVLVEGKHFFSKLRLAHDGATGPVDVDRCVNFVGKKTSDGKNQHENKQGDVLCNLICSNVGARKHPSARSVHDHIPVASTLTVRNEKVLMFTLS